MKLKIYELATGTFRHGCMSGSFDHCEQWTFLPKNAWYSRMVLNERLTQFHKNFCLLYFYRGEFGPGHFLLMNLVTRVQFWVERDEIEEIMKAAFPNLNLNDERKATVWSKFRYFEHCFPSEEVDAVNDRFQLQSSSDDGVCISSLKINGTQI